MADAPKPTRAEWRNKLDQLLYAHEDLQRAQDRFKAAESAFLNYQPPLDHKGE